jgi:hypothetical protein
MKFLIAARPFNHQSFGVVTLHKIFEQLLLLGFEAEIIFFEGDGKDCKWGFSRNSEYYRPGAQLPPPRNYEKYINSIVSNGILIYPEIIFGNPLGAKNVVRYMLNKEGALKSWGMNAASNDFFLTHSQLYRDTYHFALFNPPDITWLNSIEINDLDMRSMDVSYIGKGSKYGFTKIPNGTLEITREWPKSQTQLRLLLNNSRYFFCFDSLSATAFEAVACGAIPFVFPGGPIPIEKLRNGLDGLPYYSGFAELDENMNIRDIQYDAHEFQSTRKEIINRIQAMHEDYPKQVSLLAEKISGHFELSS